MVEGGGNGGEEPSSLLPPPALAAAAAARETFLPRLERVGRGDAAFTAVWGCSQDDFGCNSSDSEWYRADEDDEEEEEDGEQKQLPRPPPSADLLLPWQI